DDVSLRAHPGRARRAAVARRLFRRGRRHVVRAGQGDKGIQERAASRGRVGYSPSSAIQRSESASSSAEITNTRCTATSHVILVASKAASMFRNASSTWMAEIATMEASSFCFNPAKSIVLIHIGQFGLPLVSMRETKFS